MVTYFIISFLAIIITEVIYGILIPNPIIANGIYALTICVCLLGIGVTLEGKQAK